MEQPSHPIAKRGALPSILAEWWLSFGLAFAVVFVGF